MLPETSIFQRGYDRCPLLFWVLIAVASKSLESYSHYHSALEPHIQRLATDIFSAADHPLGTVQALLILCWWPFSFHAQRNDPSWTYCGLAVHTALRFGLHRPHHFSDFVYNDSLDTPGIAAFTRAWVGCFIVNQKYGCSTAKYHKMITVFAVSAARWACHVLLALIRLYLTR